MKILTITVCSVLILSLAACQDMRGRDVGTIAGAGVGAAAGSMIGSGSGRAVGAAGGAVVGGVAGHYIGKGMEKDKTNSVK